MTATELNKTVPIVSGQAAKFDGFLIPEWQFRKMNEELIEKDLLKKQMEAPKPVEEHHPIQNFLWGLLAGSTAILLVEKFGEK